MRPTLHLQYSLYTRYYTILGSQIYPSWLDTIVSSNPHLLSTESCEIIRGAATFYDQGLRVTPAVTRLAEMASYSFLGVPLSWVGD